MEEFLSEWEKASNESLQADFPSECSIDVVDEQCFCLEDGFYVVVNYLRRAMLGSGFEELILYLSRGPAERMCYAHLTDAWVNTTVTIGAILYIPNGVKWVVGDDDQDLYRQCHCCLLDKSTPGPVLYPHLLMRVSTLKTFKQCQRSLFFRETHVHREPTFRSIYGRIATGLVTKCIMEEMETGAFSAAELADEFNNEYTLTLCSITQETDYALKSIYELRAQVTKLAEILDRPHNVLMTVPKRDVLVKDTKCFPGFGQKNAVADETIWSFKNGFIARPSCVIEVRDEECLNYVPVDVIATLAMSDVKGSWRIGHLLSLTATLSVLCEKYEKEQANAGFIWYLGSNQRFWMKPRFIEENHVTVLRNVIVSSIVNNRLPPMDVTECQNCVSRATCALYQRMYDARDYVPFSELDMVLPRTMSDFSANPMRTFFEKYRKSNFECARSVMWSYTRLTSMTLEERERMGYAITGVEVVDVQRVEELRGKSAKINVVFKTDKPGKIYHCLIARRDVVLVTRDGKAPIIAFANCVTFDDETLTITGHENCFTVGERYVLDFCQSDYWYESNNAALSSLLMDPRYAMLSSYLIGGRKPMFTTTEPKFDRLGLNPRQQEAVSMALKASSYLLINAPNGTGRIATCLRIVYAKASAGFSVLLAPFFYSSLNKLCAGLELLGINYVVCGRLDKIDEQFHHRSDLTLFADCHSADDFDRIMKDIRVFVVTSAAKQFDIICNRYFHMVILFEASRLPLLRAVSSLRSGAPFILFGDTVMDSDVDSIYSHLARISPQSIISLWEMYDCEPVIVSAARLIWGSELRCSAPHVSISLKPLRVLDKSIRELFTDIITMDRPLVFVQTDNYLAAAVVSVVAGLVFETVHTISRRELLPQLSSCLFAFRTMGESVFTKFNKYMSSAAARVKLYASGSIISKRKNVVVALASHCDSSILQLALGRTRCKLILVGKPEDVSESPMWATVLNQMPQDWKFTFPSSLLTEQTAPFKPVQDIEDLLL